MRITLIGAALAAVCSAHAGAAERPAARYDSGTLSGLGARNIGSAAMSGRIAALDAHHDENGRITIYVAAASGGVWKSSDGGTTFKPVFDKQPVQSIGAIAVDPSNSKNIWVGTGEAWTRNSVSVGNGIYRSSDAGETWQHVGLPQSERVAEILVHPRNGNVVYACVPGKLWSDSSERGLYKTSDGGRSWAHVLKGPNLSTGCSNLALDAKNPDTVYASLWDFRRKGWTFRSGGDGAAATSGSGMFKSVDGGRTWSELGQGDKGFGPKPYGRIGIAVAPSNPDRVYAVVESTRSALFRSDDGGKTWEEGDRSQSMVWRPFYFAHLVVDPTNPDRLFKFNYHLITSTDGGKSFSTVTGGTHGDHHDLWINPKDPNHVITGDDGGLWISYNGGNYWVKNENLPLSQFYHVSVDDRDPYLVYGGMQDNSSWVGHSAFPGGITNHQWENMYGGDGFWMFSDPADPDYIYAEYQGGNIARIHRTTHEARSIQPTARLGEKLRFNWNAPIHLSPNEKGTIYIGAQYLFRSRDQGASWDRISPDLTTNDPRKQQQEQSGGITVDNSSAEMHTTIYSISESPKNGKVIWVGTDDGNLQLTRDGGGSWSNVAGNVRKLPKHSWVSWVEASRHDAATAYVAFDRHMEGDTEPHVFVTRDYGRTFTRIAGAAQGIRGYAHVIREDTVAPNLLFLGTELGLWISPDGGRRWAEFKGGNFPSVAVRDLVIQERESDLVLGTHGRGIWIVDDISPLRALTDDVLSSDAAFLAARPIEQKIQGSGGWANGDQMFVGPNPPGGAVITYYQPTRHLFGNIKLEILDASGKVVDEIPASKRRGINRVNWSMRVKPPRVPRAATLAYAGTQGPRVLPGVYTVRLTKGKEVLETKLPITLDDRATYTLEDRKAQYDAAMRMHALFGEMSTLSDRIQFVQQAGGQVASQLPEGDPLRAEATAVSAKAEAIRKKIVATKEGGAITGEERLREHSDNLYGAILSWDGRPGAYHLERIDVLAKELDGVESEFAALESGELARVNAKLKAKSLPEIVVPPAAAAAA
ncbi:MAG TPA: sialidase, partial [Candidatus Saccharimonadia bacterium]|nr:sialidase [Candidatus Saccharimonadia bacterium]